MATKECATVLQGRLVDDHCCAFCLDSFHDTLNAALAEIVTVTLHCQTVDTDNNLPFLIRIEVLCHGTRKMRKMCPGEKMESQPSRAGTIDLFKN